MGLFDQRQQARHEWIATGPGLWLPSDVAVDSVGNVYVADLVNRVLKLPAG
jgi:hypothetical protein